MLVDAAPNIERAGVIAGFVLSAAGAAFGYERVVACTMGVLFAQSVMYRPAVTPSLPLVTLGQQSWLFYNSVAGGDNGFYWANAPVPVVADDAFVGWAVADATHVVLTSSQRIVVPDPTGAQVDVIPLGPVLGVGPGGGTHGDTGMPAVMQYTTTILGKGAISFSQLNPAPPLAIPLPGDWYAKSSLGSLGSATFRINYRDETAAALDALTADVDAVTTSLPMGDLTHFVNHAFYLIDQEIVQMEQATLILRGGPVLGPVQFTRGCLGTIARPHFGPKTITGATNATPIVLTCVGHGRVQDESTVVSASAVGGNTAANGGWGVGAVAADTLELQGSAGNAAYTSGGVLAGSQVYTLQQATAAFVLPPQLFVVQTEGYAWASSSVDLPHALIAAVESWWTNAFGDSTHQFYSQISYNLGHGFQAPRTQVGYVVTLEVDGVLGIEPDATKEVLIPYDSSCHNVWATVLGVPLGAAVRLLLKRNGAAWAAPSIPDGAANSADYLNGLALAPLLKGDRLGLDITGVGTGSYPGSRLSVRVVL
jgi:hypothetical protein